MNKPDSTSAHKRRHIQAGIGIVSMAALPWLLLNHAVTASYALAITIGIATAIALHYILDKRKKPLSWAVTTSIQVVASIQAVTAIYLLTADEPQFFHVDSTGLWLCYTSVLTLGLSYPKLITSKALVLALAIIASTVLIKLLPWIWLQALLFVVAVWVIQQSSRHLTEVSDESLDIAGNEGRGDAPVRRLR